MSDNYVSHNKKWLLYFNLVLATVCACYLAYIFIGTVGSSSIVELKQTASQSKLASEVLTNEFIKNPSPTHFEFAFLSSKVDEAIKAEAIANLTGNMSTVLAIKNADAINKSNEEERSRRIKTLPLTKLNSVELALFFLPYVIAIMFTLSVIRVFYNIFKPSDN